MDRVAESLGGARYVAVVAVVEVAEEVGMNTTSRTMKRTSPATDPPMMAYILVLLFFLVGGGVRSQDPMLPPIQPQASLDMPENECISPSPCSAQQLPGGEVDCGQDCCVPLVNGFQLSEWTHEWTSL